MDKSFVHFRSIQSIISIWFSECDAAPELTMPVTSVSLLDRLKEARPDASDWDRLQGIYLPLINRWLGRVPGLGVEADDLTQEVFLVVTREISAFQRQREGSFRAWLRQVTVNKVRSHRKKRYRRPTVGTGRRRTGSSTVWPTPTATLPENGTWTTIVTSFRNCSRSSSLTSARRHWEAFRRFAVDGQPATQVAEEMGLSVNAVIQAKARVLKRLREEAGDLLT